MLAMLASIMTPYEWARVLIAFCQLIVMLGIPFVLHKLEKRERDERERKRKDK